MASLRDSSKEKYQQRYDHFNSFVRKRTRTPYPKANEDDVALYSKHLKEDKGYASKTMWSALSMCRRCSWRRLT